MARGINKVILVGNLGNDPETRSMPNGSAVTNISIATTESWKDKNSGQQQERTEWHRIVFFNRLAEIAGQYLKKGHRKIACPSTMPLALPQLLKRLALSRSRFAAISRRPRCPGSFGQQLRHRKSRRPRFVPARRLHGPRNPDDFERTRGPVWGYQPD